MSKQLSVSIPELGLIAATRGMIGFGAGMLLANKISRNNRKYIGLPLFFGGVLSTIPIAMHLFHHNSEKLEAISDDVDANAGNGN